MATKAILRRFDQEVKGKGLLKESSLKNMWTLSSFFNYTQI